MVVAENRGGGWVMAGLAQGIGHSVRPPRAHVVKGPQKILSLISFIILKY